MATSRVAIWNSALSHVGNSTEVQTPTENSPNANACRIYYDEAIAEALEAFSWPFAKVIVALGLVEENPTPEWGYSYRYPSDCVNAIRIASVLYSVRNPGPGQIIPYKIGRDASGKLIYCDLENASLEYVQSVTDESQYSALFAQAVSFRLASYIAPRVTGGDPYQLGKRALGMYYATIANAQGHAFNEEQADEPPDAEWITARE